MKSVSNLLSIVFGFNILQIVIILYNKDIHYSWISFFLIVPPLLYISYYAMKLNKVAYILILYWFGIQIINLNLDFFSYNFYFGLNFQLMLFNDSIGIDPIALLMFILSVLEIDKVIPKKS